MRRVATNIDKGGASKPVRKPFEALSKGVVEPVYATIAGVALVTIPAAHYAELLAKAAGFSADASDTRPLRLSDVRSLRPATRGRVRLPSTIERDPEVASFLRERFAAADTLAMAHASCVERFGAERSPSTSRIAQFRVRVREGA